MNVDPRGPRFGAAITTVVLAVVLLTASGWLLLAQTLVFAMGALAGLRYAPYGFLYRHLVRPRLGPPSRTEAEAPPRFAQGVGMVIAAPKRGPRGSTFMVMLPDAGKISTLLRLPAVQPRLVRQQAPTAYRSRSPRDRSQQRAAWSASGLFWKTRTRWYSPMAPLSLSA